MCGRRGNARASTSDEGAMVEGGKLFFPSEVNVIMRYEVGGTVLYVLTG